LIIDVLIIDLQLPGWVIVRTVWGALYLICEEQIISTFCRRKKASFSCRAFTCQRPT
jgi:hypothetical protein